MDGSRLQVNVLGELSASCAGEPLDLGGPRQRAVLAVLLLARGEIVPADRIVESVWGDRPPGDTTGALQSYVSHLRRRLEPGSAARTRSAVIVREGPGYAVRLPRDAVDAWRFEDLLARAATAPPAQALALLEEALGLWRGPALADYADESWAAAEIGRLTGLRNTARERLLAVRLDLGEAGLLVPDLEAMVAEEPLREERWRLLALALYRCDRQADALAALRRARTTLADELGVDPGPALRELEEQVLAQSPALRVPVPRAAETPPAPAPAVAEDLADRDRELAAVRSAIDALAAGESGLLLIEGPAGIGKTRLLTEARRLAGERSLRVLSARGSQLEKAFGFNVVRQLFEPELIAPDRRAELLNGAAAAARGVFDLTAGEADGSFAIMHGLYWLAVNVSADGPLLLAVDDLQWCDTASLRWLAYLVRRLDGVPVLLVTTLRTGEQHDDELLSELELEPAAVVVTPGPLSPEATARMVGRRLGEPVSPLFASACHRTTSGNPLLLRQLVRGLEADRVRPDAAHADRVVAVGSRAVASMVTMRLRRLPDVRSVARAAAVLGDGAPLPAVAALADRTEADTAAALAALARAEIVKDEWPLAFAHPLVRDAVYRELPAPERALLHERAAGVLRAAGAPDEQRAAHLLLSPRRGDDETVALLRRAAATAAERGASDTAVTLLRRALDEPPTDDRVRRDLLTELGLLESLVEGAEGVEHLLQAYAQHDDPRTRADLAVVISRTQVFASPLGVATAFAREARLALPDELDDHRQALAALERQTGFMHGLDPALWRTDPPPEPRGDGPGAQMLAAALGLETTMAGVDRPRAIELARSALARDQLFTVDYGLFWVVAAVTRMLADDDLGDFWARSRAAAHARGSVFAVHSSNLWQGMWHWRRGELDEALGLLRMAYDQAKIWGHVALGNPYCRAFEIGVHLDRGDLAAARRVADAATAEPGAGDGHRLLQHWLARLLVAEGRFEEALGAVVALPAPVPIPNPAWNPWRSTGALALHGLGRAEEAVQLAEEEVRLLRRWGAPSYLGTALVVLGRLRAPSGVDELREAVELLSGTTAAVDLARARCALGAAPQVPDDEAIPLLRESVESASRLGAQAVLRRACAALKARGVSDGSREVAPRRSGMERPVLALAAAGLGVPEIAQRLFLAPGTVAAVLEAVDGERLKFLSSTPTDAVHP